MKLFAFGVAMLSIAHASAQAASFAVSDFAHDGLSGWDERKVEGQTHYAVKQDEGHAVLEARSKGSASGYYKKVRIDLDKTPFLNWSWKVQNILQNNDEKTKNGDDYPARVYVVFTSGAAFWKTRSLNYVWSSHEDAGSAWPNAGGATARMIAVESGAEHLGQWINFKRNIRDDFKKYFGEDVSQVDAVAFMTDTDNSRQSAAAFYGDIFFTSE